jgi:hypothetical protein
LGELIGNNPDSVKGFMSIALGATHELQRDGQSLQCRRIKECVTFLDAE